MLEAARRKQNLLAMEQDRLSSSEAVGTKEEPRMCQAGESRVFSFMFFRVGLCQTRLLGPNLLLSVYVGFTL